MQQQDNHATKQLKRERIKKCGLLHFANMILNSYKNVQEENKKT